MTLPVPIRAPSCSPIKQQKQKLAFQRRKRNSGAKVHRPGMATIKQYADNSMRPARAKQVTSPDHQPLTVFLTMKRDAPYRTMPQDSCEDLTLLKKGSSDEFLSLQATELDLARCRKRLRLLGVVVIAQFCVLLCVLGIGLALYARRGPLNPIFPQTLYSPAQHLIEYETRVFHEGFGKDESIYQQAPSPEVDEAWTDLYNFGVSKITRSEASQLVNQTYRLPGDEDHFVIQLDVFHQLHCLNMLRKAIWPSYYPEMDKLDPLHWGHCIESLRQSLMCSADITPLVWQWVDRVKEVRIMGNIIHTCRNYDKIKDWGIAHQLDHELNFTGFH